MSKLQMMALLSCALPVCAFAGDKDEAKPVSPAPVTTTETVKTEVVYEEDHSGSSFVHFWKHTVGGTIHNGLKKGTDKVTKTF